MKKEDLEHSTSFLVPMWEGVLKFLERLSIFNLIRTLLPTLSKKYWFVDAWVVGNLVFSIASVYLVYYLQKPSIIVKLIVIYGILRVFEIFIYQLNVLLVHPFKHTEFSSYTLYSYRRMIVTLIHNFFEIIFWFATTYIAFEFVFENNIGDLNPLYVIYNSFITMVSYTSNLNEKSFNIAALTILHTQAIIGLFMTIISLARFVSLFPKPETMDKREQEFTIYDDIKRIEQSLKVLNEKLDKKDDKKI